MSQTVEPRSRRWWILRIALGVGAAALTVLALLLVQERLYQAGDPAILVEQYLVAIADGDEQQADEIAARVEKSLYETETMLPVGALANATERITVEEVRTVNRNEEDAVVTAKFALAGKEYERLFSLTREPGGVFRPDGWTLEDRLLGRLYIYPSTPFGTVGYQPELTVGGTEVTLSLGQRVAAVGYPAVYPVAVSSSEYFDGSTSEGMMPPEDPGDDSNKVGLPIEPNDAFLARMFEEGARFAQACIDVREAVVVLEQGERVSCPNETEHLTAEMCAVAGTKWVTLENGWSITCGRYSDTAFFGASVRAEVVGDELGYSSVPGRNYLSYLGPYRFTDTESGAETLQYLNDIDIEWRDGIPGLSTGSFDDSRWSVDETQ